MTNCVMFVSIIDEKYALIVDSTCFSAMRVLICHVLLVVSIFYVIKGGRPVALALAFAWRFIYLCNGYLSCALIGEML